ncbi:hypothetical protein ACQP2Y_12660 [Actinoplanes sp. CA-051413]|uniref:hypothetical protein n=1 Tax=Actinoplanes sp. CA-051413 TaxID=3239899 RepID=UPI003D99E7F1
MAYSDTVMSTGAVCFGVVTGYITYRTLARTTASARVSDLASVLGAVGGGLVTTLLPQESDAFGWYAIGLAIGMLTYFVVSLIVRGKPATAEVLGGPDDVRPRSR